MQNTAKAKDNPPTCHLFPQSSKPALCWPNLPSQPIVRLSAEEARHFQLKSLKTAAVPRPSVGQVHLRLALSKGNGVDQFVGRAAAIQRLFLPQPDPLFTRPIRPQKQVQFCAPQGHFCNPIRPWPKCPWPPQLKQQEACRKNPHRICESTDQLVGRLKPPNTLHCASTQKRQNYKQFSIHSIPFYFQSLPISQVRGNI